MNTCEICSKPIRRGDEYYLKLPDKDKSYCICAGCRSCLTVLTGEVGNIQLLEISTGQINGYIEKGDIEEDLKQYLQSLVSSVEAKKEAAERKEEEAERRRISAIERTAELNEIRRNFKMTTGYQFDGYKTTKYIKVVSGEIVLGGGALKELSASVSDVLGARSGAYESNLGKAKKKALDKAMENAINAGANALLGIDFDITTIGGSMMVVSANGTAVVIEEEGEI